MPITLGTNAFVPPQTQQQQQQLVVFDNDNNELDCLLNVSGRSLSRNEAKTIWSYNPEDISAVNNKRMRRRKNTNNINNNQKQKSKKFRKLKKTSRKTSRFDENEDDATTNDTNLYFTKHFLAQLQTNNQLNSKTSFYEHEDIDTSRLDKNLITIDSYSYLFEKLFGMNMSGSGGGRGEDSSKPQTAASLIGKYARANNKQRPQLTNMTKKPVPVGLNSSKSITIASQFDLYDDDENNNDNNEEEGDSAEVDETDDNDKSRPMSSSVYKNALSRLIRTRYTTEPHLDSSFYDKKSDLIDEKSSSSSPAVVLYDKNGGVDSLTPEVLAKLSRGLNRKLLLADEAEQNQANDYMDEINTCEDELESEMGGGENEEPEPEAEDDYEDDKIIFETNIIRNSSNTTITNNIENEDDNDPNLVMKICNGIESSRKTESKNQEKKLYTPKSIRSLRSIVDELVLEDEKPFEENTNAYDDYEYEYTDAIGDELRRLLDRYDGTQTAELFLKQQLPPLEQYVAQTLLLTSSDENEETTDDENEEEKDKEDEEDEEEAQMEGDEKQFKEEMKRKRLVEREMALERARASFLMLKRMMVKKKYVLATLRVEKEAANRRNTSNRVNAIRKSASLVKSRPVTAANETNNAASNSSASFFSNSNNANNNNKLARPKTVNIIPIKPVNSVNSMDRVDTVESLKTGDEIEDQQQQQQQQADAILTKTTTNNEEFFYESYRISSPIISHQTWPFELEFEKNPPRVSQPPATTSIKRTTTMQSLKNNTPTNKPNPTTSTTTTTTTKCYPCKKLPIVVQKPQEAPSAPTNLSTPFFPHPVTNTNTHPQPIKTPISQAQLSSGNNQAINQQTSTKPPLPTSTYQQGRQQQLISKPHTDPTTTTPNTTSNHHLNSTYNSSRRSISAKILPTPQQTQQFKPAIVADTDILNESDLINDRKKCEVNKEEQMRRMNIVPGRTFRSQRRKSISVEHIPPSRKKLDTQRMRVLLSNSTSSSSATQNSSDQQNNNINKTTSPTTTPQIVMRQVEIKNMDVGLTRANNANNATLRLTSSSAGGALRNRSFAALAYQHHEEIFSLIRKDLTSSSLNLSKMNNSSNNSNNNNNNNGSSSCSSFNNPRVDRNLMKEEINALVYRVNKFAIKSSSTGKRPKTSKV